MATLSTTLQAQSPQELETMVNNYIAQGYSVVNRTPNQVTLLKRKEFSIPWLIIGFFLCLIPLLIYLIVYTSEQDKMVVISLVGPQPGSYRGSPQLTAPPTAPRSPDGKYWWDGQAWQPVQGTGYGMPPSTPNMPSSSPYSAPYPPQQGSTPYPPQPGAAPYQPPQ